MPSKNLRLHGNVPDKCDTALLLIDVINDLEFDTGEALLEFALPAAEQISQLKQRCKKQGIASIYCNDNFGRWRSDFHQQVDHCLKDGVRGEAIARLLKPDQEDYFVLKPKHSAFYATPLDILLEYLGVKTVILTGFTGDMCVLFTAMDAYVRNFNLIVPADCVASADEESNRQALAQMKNVLKSEISFI